MLGTIKRVPNHLRESIAKKIDESLDEYAYLHRYLSGHNENLSTLLSSHDYRSFEFCQIGNMLRRIWITKLLAYEGE